MLVVPIGPVPPMHAPMSCVSFFRTHNGHYIKIVTTADLLSTDRAHFDTSKAPKIMHRVQHWRAQRPWEAFTLFLSAPRSAHTRTRSAEYGVWGPRAELKKRERERLADHSAPNLDVISRRRRASTLSANSWRWHEKSAWSGQQGEHARA